MKRILIQPDLSLFTCSTLRQAPGLSRLVRTDLPGTDTLAYFGPPVNYGRKKFYKIGPVANVIKHFTSVIYEFLY